MPTAKPQPGPTKHRPAPSLGVRRRLRAFRPTSSRSGWRGTPMPYGCKTPDDVLKAIKDDQVAMVDLRFADLPGLWQHFSVPPGAFGPDSFAGGVGFDGSSIRGFQEIQESDMLVVPDPATTIRDPVSGRPYSRDARHIAQKAEAHLKGTGIADTAYLAGLFNALECGGG